MTSTEAEARVRIAAKGKLGDAATIVHLKQEDGKIVLHVVAPLHTQRAVEEAVLAAVEEVLPFLRTEELGIECKVNDRWVPRT